MSAAHAERRLTLEEALHLARSRNPDLTAARARFDQARTGIEQAWTALLPTASAQVKYTHNYKDVSLDLPPAFGVPGPVVIQKGEQLDAQIGFSVPLLAPGAYPALRAARHTVASARANFDVSEVGILYAGAQAYFTAAGADELLAARRHAIEVARVTSKTATDRFGAGTVVRTEVTRAELALLRAEQAAVEAEDARQQAYRALATLLGLREPFRVVPGEPGAAPPAGTAAELGAKALRLRPELAAAETSIRAAESQAKAARWRWAPTLSAFGQLRGFNYAGFSGDNYAWAVGLQLDFALYDGGAREAALHLARAQRRESEARLQLLRDTVADEVANAQRALVTKRSALRTAERSVVLARDTLAIMRVQYEAGTATQLDLLQAQDSLVAAEVSQAQARLDLLLADLTLRRAAGTFPETRSQP
jgi:outer membrane protein TolC